MSNTENCKVGKTFKNWAETIEFKPKFYCHPKNAEAVRSIIEKGEFLLASRFHAMISGLATSTPTVVVGWSHKYREVLAGFGLEEYSVPFTEFTVETLTDLSLRAFEDRERISSQITEHLPEFKALAAVSFKA